MKELMTIDDLSEYLKLSKPKLYPMIRQGKIPGFKIDGSLRFCKADIDKWLEEKRIMKRE